MSAASTTQLMTEQDYKFMEYVSSYGKMYGTKAEYDFRSAIFKQNLAHIEEWNSQGHTHTLGLNKFSDWTKDELKRLKGYRKGKDYGKRQEVMEDIDIPKSVDWRQKGAVTPIKD